MLSKYPSHGAITDLEMSNTVVEAIGGAEPRHEHEVVALQLIHVYLHSKVFYDSSIYIFFAINE